MSSDFIQVAKKKLLEINKTIEKLDPAIRSAAFGILAPVYFGEELPDKTPSWKEKPFSKETVSTHDKDKFYARFPHENPADCVLLIVAWLYSQYGAFPITKAAIQKEADDVGLTIPTRSDNTMRQATQNGKTLFRKSRKGWQVTVFGESYLKKTFAVKKGAKPRPDESNE